MNRVDTATDRPNEFPITVRTRAHAFHADVSSDSGGTDSAPGAHDFFDAALATCKAHTAMWYAKRKGIPLERVETWVERDDSGERNGVYKLRCHVTLHGPLTDEQRAAVVQAVAKCPIHKLMTTSDVQVEMVE